MENTDTVILLEYCMWFVKWILFLADYQKLVHLLDYSVQFCRYIKIYIPLYTCQYLALEERGARHTQRIGLDIPFHGWRERNLTQLKVPSVRMFDKVSAHHCDNYPEKPGFKLETYLEDPLRLLLRKRGSL